MCRPKRIKVMKSFEVEGVKVDLFPAKRERRPAVYLNCYEGKEVHELLEGEDFNLIAISVRDWFCDLVPWSITSPFKDGRRFVGGAGEYLQLLTQKIIPRAGELMAPVSWLGIAGYSLGGLFALYAFVREPRLAACACLSGSVWYEGWVDWLRENAPNCAGRYAYFSVGKKEERAGLPFRHVEEDLAACAEILRAHGCKVDVALGPGSHMQHVTERLAAGLVALDAVLA